MIGTENTKPHMISPRTFIRWCYNKITGVIMIFCEMTDNSQNILRNLCHEPLVYKNWQSLLANYITDRGLDSSLIVISNTFDLIMQKIIITPVILL